MNTYEKTTIEMHISHFTHEISTLNEDKIKAKLDLESSNEDINDYYDDEFTDYDFVDSLYIYDTANQIAFDEIEYEIKLLTRKREKLHRKLAK